MLPRTENSAGGGEGGSALKPSKCLEIQVSRLFSGLPKNMQADSKKIIILFDIADVTVKFIEVSS
jgi:hypothetical protein